MVSATQAHAQLGLAYARTGGTAQAIDHLEAALASGLLDATSRPDVYAALSRAYADAGEPRKAAALFELGLDEVARFAPGEPAAQARYATYVSFAFTGQATLERVPLMLRQALAQAPVSSDPYQRVRSYWALGQTAEEQGKPIAALEHFRRAAAMLETIDDTVRLARAHLAIATSAIGTGALDDAETEIGLAEELLGPQAEGRDVAILRRTQADLAIARGQGPEAIRHGREAAAAAPSPGERGLALATVAAGQVLAGDGEADATYAEALALLTEHGSRREQNDLLRAYARYLRAEGRESEALDVLEAATVLVDTVEA